MRYYSRRGMKRTLSLLIILIFLLAGIVFGLHYAQSEGTQAAPAPAINHIGIATPTPVPAVPTPGIPRNLSIPAINLNAFVESVGLDAQGRMDVPEHNEDVAWFHLGYRPGMKGSAVIDGHLDTVTGAPAAFWNLDKLQSGDTISVTDSTGTVYAFKVVDKESYPYDQVPLQQVFNTTDQSRLNLITCSGTWDRGARNYSQRTVVYAVKE